MTAILRWLGCAPQEQKYHSLQDDPHEAQKLNQDSIHPSDQRITAYKALKNWESEFSKDECDIDDSFKVYKFAQKVLERLIDLNALSPSNTDEIGCHLWAMAKTSEKKLGRDSMFRYFFDNLPEVLGDKNRDIAAKIRVAMIGSGNRQTYAQS